MAFIGHLPTIHDWKIPEKAFLPALNTLAFPSYQKTQWVEAVFPLACLTPLESRKPLDHPVPADHRFGQATAKAAAAGTTAKAEDDEPTQKTKQQQAEMTTTSLLPTKLQAVLLQSSAETGTTAISAVSK
ncbi:hypothetical protein LTR37_008989 [Vermiconidia calcicola]|uniref:Uncharacterized protein n=1 Tax=Vermiconidia calcicola TaxID=1690605 RepID=A0ACC3NAF4_9PEZI|nr:hypothetical protein LTR37_008989 [Vermiconidia calcicola]